MGTDHVSGSGMTELVRPITEKDVNTVESSPDVTPIVNASCADQVEEERRVRRKIDTVVLPTVSTTVLKCGIVAISSRKF
jgi:hypothetical protein